MVEVGSQESEWTGVFIVRDKNGNVKFDDWANIPEIFINHLNQADLDYIKQKAEA